MNACIFLPNWLGDLTMATPALRAMRERFGPNARLVGILRPHLTGLLAGTDWLDELWPYHPKAGQGERISTWTLARRMRAERFDLALLLTNSFRTGLAAALGRAKTRVGYARYGRRYLLTDPISPPRREGRIRPEPVVDSYLRLTRHLGCPPGSRQLELAVTPAEAAEGERAWTAAGLRDDRPVVALNCSGAYGAAKLWPPEHFATLAQLLVDRLGHQVLVICGPADAERQRARAIAAQADRENVVSLADGPLGIGVTKATLARCRMLISTDSGPRHVGAALGLPVVTVMGPTDSIWIANPTIRGVDVRHDALPCLGCARRTCPLGHHRCMRELSAERVFGAAAQVLATEPSKTEDKRRGDAA